MPYVTLHDDEILEAARERLGTAERPLEYGGHYLDCPGCARLVHHNDRFDHPERCQAIRDLVVYEADAHRDAQPSRPTASGEG